MLLTEHFRPKPHARRSHHFAKHRARCGGTQPCRKRCQSSNSRTPRVPGPDRRPDRSRHSQRAASPRPRPPHPRVARGSIPLVTGGRIARRGASGGRFFSGALVESGILPQAVFGDRCDSRVGVQVARSRRHARVPQGDAPLQEGATNGLGYQGIIFADSIDARGAPGPSPQLVRDVAEFGPLGPAWPAWPTWRCAGQRLGAPLGARRRRVLAIPGVSADWRGRPGGGAALFLHDAGPPWSPGTNGPRMANTGRRIVRRQDVVR